MLLDEGADKGVGLEDLRRKRVWNSFPGEWDNKWNIVWLNWSLSKFRGHELKDHLLEAPNISCTVRNIFKKF